MLDMKLLVRTTIDDRMESLEATKPTKCAFFLKYLPPSMVAGESLDRRPTSTAKEDSGPLVKHRVWAVRSSAV